MGDCKKMQVAMPTLSSIANKPPVDIYFENITYVRGKKKILNDISGQFQSGKLTAILGPSGAGKSSLMDVLTGRKCTGLSGTVKVNNCIQNKDLFHMLSCYVMQEDLLQPNLTVLEAVTVAAKLKLGKNVKGSDKIAIVHEVLRSLGLEECYNTFTNRLSGGQQKRFRIALELVDNPSVIFLDEPTTGLDYQSCSQCIELLKMFSSQGRTVICTIHQPSALHFKQFDQIYVMTKGACIYQGTSDLLIPFLTFSGFSCPTHYNPADYVIEILQESSAEQLRDLPTAVDNGKLMVCKSTEGPNSLFSTQKIKPNEKHESLMKNFVKLEQPSFFSHIIILAGRMFLQERRNKLVLLFLLANNLLGGLVVGLLFYQSGNNGDKPTQQIFFLGTCNLAVCYCQIIAGAVLYPFELKRVQSEYFNGWYSLREYFIASTFTRLPFMHGMIIIFAVVTYLISGQPLELNRFLWFYILLVLVSISSESYGLVIGSIFRSQMGAIMGPSVMAPIVALWQYNFGAYHTTSAFMKTIMNMSFFRLGMVASVIALLKDRKQLDCNSMYCPFSYPNVILKMAGAEEYNITTVIVSLIGMNLLLRLICYFLIHLKLASDFYYPLWNQMYKVLHPPRNEIPSKDSIKLI